MLRTALVASAILLLLVCEPVLSEGSFEPHVLVYAGRLSGYGEALAEIIEETGTRAIVIDSDAVMRCLLPLPQTRCVVIAARNPSDYIFLRDFAPAFLRYFAEGGSYVGLGPCCSTDLEELSTTIFPIGGNGTVRGAKSGEDFGSFYVLSEVLAEITDGLPANFLITQESATYLSGPEGPIEPTTDQGELKVLYREQSTGIPLVVAMESKPGGRSVSLPGCQVVGVERLPFYWGRLVEQEEFRELLRRSVDWAMAGNGRFDQLHPSIDERLKEERARLDSLREAGADQQAGEARRRTLILVAVWGVALILQAYLVMKFVLPRFRSAE